MAFTFATFTTGEITVSASTQTIIAYAAPYGSSSSSTTNTKAILRGLRVNGKGAAGTVFTPVSVRPYLIANNLTNLALFTSLITGNLYNEAYPNVFIKGLGFSAPTSEPSSKAYTWMPWQEQPQINIDEQFLEGKGIIIPPGDILGIELGSSSSSPVLEVCILIEE
jgi:hypothetical protein